MKITWNSALSTLARMDSATDRAVAAAVAAEKRIEDSFDSVNDGIVSAFKRIIRYFAWTASAVPGWFKRLPLAQWHGGKILLCWVIVLVALPWFWEEIGAIRFGRYYYVKDTIFYLPLTLLRYGLPLAAFVLTWKWFSLKERN